MYRVWLTVCSLFLCVTVAVAAEQVVTVADPYIDLHTGPGIGYPRTQIIERGEAVTIIKRRTEWFKVRGPRGYEGWAHRDQMERTLQPSGRLAEFPDADLEAWQKSRWSAGLTAGRLRRRQRLYSLTGSYRMSRHLSAEARRLAGAGRFFPTAGGRASILRTHFSRSGVRHRFFSLGTGMIKRRTEVHAGAGGRPH